MRRLRTGSSPLPNSAPVSDQRPCTAGCAPLRRRVPNVRRRSARARCDHEGVALSLGERSGANASLVASPAHTRSHSAFCSSSVVGAGDVGQQVGEEARRRRAGARAPVSWTGSDGALAGARRRAEQRGVVAEVERDAPRAARARPRRPRRPRRSRTAGPATPASRRRCGAAARRAPTPPAAARGPAAGRAPRAAGRRPRRWPGGGRRPASGARKRANARWSAGSISARSAASEARRSRRSTSGSHHSRCVPPGRSSPRTSAAGGLQALEHGRQVDAVAVAQRARLERAVGARVAAHQPLHRVWHVGDERLGQPGRRDGAERVAVQARVLGGDPAPLAADAQEDRAALAAPAARARPARPPRRTASSSLRSPSAAQDVVQRVGGVRAGAFGAPLQVGLHALQRARVDQLAQLLLAEQLAQQVAVERERGRAALRVGLVALVHVRRDVVEQQRRRERRCGLRLDLDQRQLAPVQASTAGRAGPAGRARRAGTRGRSPARSGTARSGARPRAGSATSAAAATAACAGRGRRAGSAARGPRSRGSARRTAPSRPAPRRPGPRARPASIITSSTPGASSASGRWTMMPSSDQIASDSRPYCSRMRALSASPQAACTRPP